MKKTFWNKLTAHGTRGKTRCAAAVLALAMTFSMGAPLALAAQPEEAAASAGTVQEADMPTLQPETPELAAERTRRHRPYRPQKPKKTARISTPRKTASC